METGLQGRELAFAQTGAVCSGRPVRPSRPAAAGSGPQVHWTRPWSFGIRSPALCVNAASRIASSGAGADTRSRTDSGTTAQAQAMCIERRGPAALLDSLPTQAPEATTSASGARQPQPAHTLTTSPELLRRRHEQLAAAQDLTRQLSSAASVAEAKELFAAHGERFNGIHWSALLTRLARLDAGAVAPAHPRGLQTAAALTSTSYSHSVSDTIASQPATRVRLQAHHSDGQLPAPAAPPAAPRLAGSHRTLTPRQRSELRELVSQQLLPRLGLSLMGLAPRQLAAVLAALAELALPPPAFWMDEWLQHFGRRLEAATTVAAPSAAVGGSVEAEARSGGGAGSEGVAAAAVSRPRSQLQPQRPNTCDIAQAMWALARLRGMQSDSGAAAAELSQGVEAADPPDASTASLFASSTIPATGRASSPLPDTSSSSSSNSDNSNNNNSGSGGGGGGGGPSLVWLDSAAAAFAAAASTGAPRELSGYLAAAARLGYRPPASAMAAILGRCAALMRHELGAEAEAAVVAERAARSRRGEEAFGPRELSGVLWALATLGFNPGAAWLGLADRLLLRLAGGEEEGGEGKCREAGGAASSMTAAAQAQLAPEVHVQQHQQQQQVVLIEEDKNASALPRHDPQSATSTTPPSRPAADPSDWWGEHFAYAAGAACLATATTSVVEPPKAQSPQLRGRTLQPPWVLLDTRQAATCAWALAKLSHTPPPAVMSALLCHTCGGSGKKRSSTSSLVSGSDSARGTVGSAGRSAGTGGLALRAARAQDLSMLVFALGALRYRPEQSQQAAALLAAMAARMHTASDQDLVVWVAALSRLRLAVPAAWAEAMVRQTAPRLDSLPPLALVNWVAAMAELQTAAVAAPVLEAMAADQGHQGGAQDRRSLRLTKASKEVLYWEGKAARAKQQQQQRGQQQQHSGQDRQAAGPWVVLALPLRGTPSSGDALAAGLAPATAELTGRNQATVSAASHSPYNNRAVDGVVVRPAAALLRPVLLARLARLSTARLPDLDLEATCRLAWAAARLRVRPGARGLGLAGDGGWVDTLVSSSMDKLERRLQMAQPYEQAQQQPQVQAQQGRGQGPRPAGSQGTRGGQTAGSERTIVSPAAPVVGAEWLLKLVWAVAALLRRHRAGLHRSALRQPLLAHLWNQRLRMRQQLRLAGVPVDKSVLVALRSPVFKASASAELPAGWSRLRCRRGGKAGRQGQHAGEAAAGEAAAVGSARPAALVRRRWCTLLMAALWPQLASLSNTQLLRLVNGMAALYESGRTGDGFSSPSSSSGSGSRSAADDGVAPSRATAVSRPPPAAMPPQRQRRMAAALHEYCRQRVEATCGGDDACDVTTAGLLRVTSAWQADGTDEVAVEQEAGVRKRAG